MSTTTSNPDNIKRKSLVSSIHLHLRTLRRHAEGNVLTLRLRIMFSVLCISIITVWALFLLPIVVYSVQLEVCGIATHHVINLYLFFFQAEYNVRNMSAITNVTGNCSQNFARVELAYSSQCVPVCGEWREFPQHVVLALQIFRSVLYTIHFIGTVLALVLCCYNYNIM